MGASVIIWDIETIVIEHGIPWKGRSPSGPADRRGWQPRRGSVGWSSIGSDVQSAAPDQDEERLDGRGLHLPNAPYPNFIDVCADW